MSRESSRDRVIKSLKGGSRFKTEQLLDTFRAETPEQLKKKIITMFKSKYPKISLDKLEVNKQFTELRNPFEENVIMPRTQREINKDVKHLLENARSKILEEKSKKAILMLVRKKMSDIITDRMILDSMIAYENEMERSGVEGYAIDKFIEMLGDELGRSSSSGKDKLQLGDLLQQLL